MVEQLNNLQRAATPGKVSVPQALTLAALIAEWEAEQAQFSGAREWESEVRGALIVLNELRAGFDPGRGEWSLGLLQELGAS
jgi:hypothetical protein